MSDVDPITLATVAGTLDAAIREMTLTMRRVAMSPVLAIGNDFSNAIFDGQARMLTQGHDQPVHVGALMFACKEIANYFGDDVHPGDVIYHNDPRTGGSHLQDMTIYKPVFFEDQLVFWTANRSHMNETGGPVAGGYNAAATEIWAEGLRISPVKLYDRGVARRDVIYLLETNFRTRRAFRGDFGAQLAACSLAEQRLLGIVEQYGVEEAGNCFDVLIDRAERVMRAGIAEMPDGVYEGSARIEGDGHTPEELEVRATVTISGEEMHVKLSADPQRGSYINSYTSNSMSAVYLGLLPYIRSDIPLNEGMYHPVTVDLGPKGTIVNAVEPAACGLSTSTPLGHIAQAVGVAMARAVPGHAGGGWGKICQDVFTGTDPRTGEQYAYLSHLTSWGGGGAFWGFDGEPAVGPIEVAGAAKTGEVELIEYMLPFHVHRHELRADSACPGRWRGGWGLAVEIEPIDHDVQLTVMGDGMKYPSPSVLGAGAEGDESRVYRRWLVAEGEETPLRLHSLSTVPVGSRLRVYTAGGGGVGLTAERRQEDVLHDLRAGLLSIEGAAADYGVDVRSHLASDHTNE
jgi:N-methylhydantoinase B